MIGKRANASERAISAKPSAQWADAWAVVVGLGLSVLVWLGVEDVDQGELQQMVVYAVLAIVTARVLGRMTAR